MSGPIKILVTGSNGQLGNELKALAPLFPNFDFDFRSSQELNITSADAVTGALASGGYQYLINCAAYTAVDKAESETEAARAINAIATGHLAVACAASGTKFIHISTDFVFNGRGHRPYLETDPVEPVNVYGATKQEGEQLALAANGESVIIRTSWLYSSYGNNFVKTMRRLGAERPQLNVIFDQVGTPTYARDLALAIIEAIVDGKMNDASGIFHYSNEGVASWYDFAAAIMEMSGLACKVLPINTEQYPTPANRPHYSVMDKKKFKSTFGREIPYWRDSLKLCVQTIENEK